MEEEIKKLKESGKDMTILGSGSIVSQLAEQGLIDEFQVMVHPVVITDGTPFLSDIDKKIEFELIKTRSFKSGAVLLCYKPVAEKATKTDKEKRAMAHERS